jgi:hypothetical protein
MSKKSAKYWKKQYKKTKRELDNLKSMISFIPLDVIESESFDLGDSSLDTIGEHVNINMYLNPKKK